MKVIDQTPYFDHETGAISVLDRGKAIMKFGPGWFKELEAQKTVIAILDKILDKNYTLLRNVTSSLGTTLPLILIGPTGVFVMDATPLVGMFRAKGDQWGTISGNTFKPEKPNLLVRTERMARVVQVYLQRQGYTDQSLPEAILLCSDPSVHVDSLRPIIRVVIRDALERFAVSITQARVVLSPDSVRDLVDRILTPSEARQYPSATPAAAAGAAAAAAQPKAQGASACPAGHAARKASAGRRTGPGRSSRAARKTAQPAPAAVLPARRSRRRTALSRFQWIVLIGGFIFLCLLTAVFAYLVLTAYL